MRQEFSDPRSGRRGSRADPGPCTMPPPPLPSTPPAAVELYDGPSASSATCLYANFLSSVDCVVAEPGSPGTTRCGGEADRFVMVSSSWRAVADRGGDAVGRIRAP